MRTTIWVLSSNLTFRQFLLFCNCGKYSVSGMEIYDVFLLSYKFWNSFKRSILVWVFEHFEMSLHSLTFPGFQLFAKRNSLHAAWNKTSFLISFQNLSEFSYLCLSRTNVCVLSCDLPIQPPHAFSLLADGSSSCRLDGFLYHIQKRTFSKSLYYFSLHSVGSRLRHQKPF